MTAQTPHVSEEELILRFYGESSHAASVDAHLGRCGTCRSEYEAIVHTLTMVVAQATPPRGNLYGLEVWQRIRSRLPAPNPWRRVLQLRWSTAAMTAAIAVFAFAAFVAGRYWPSNAPPVEPRRALNAAPGGDERARAAAILDHLERSERVLLDVAHTGASDVEVREQQAWAAQLVDANRLYRNAATQAGETTTTLVLDDLERSLLDIVHAPSTLTPAELDEVRARLDAPALLFKVRVLSNELRERESAPPAPRKTT
jgi:hypothetical protein